MDDSALPTIAQAVFQDAAPIISLVSAPGETASVARQSSTDDAPAARQTSAAPTMQVGNQPTLQALNPVAEQVVTPVVDLVEDLVGGVIQVLDPVIEQVVAPVLDIVGDVVGDVFQVIDPVIEQVVAPVVGLVGDVVGNVVQTLNPVAEQVIAPVAGQVLTPATDILAELLGLGPDGGAPILTAPVAASSSSIDFEVGPAAGNLPLDDLFSGGGRYSDYNLALQADASIAANPALGGTLPDLNIAAELGTLIGNTPSDGGHGSHGNSHNFTLPSLLGDIGLHGLGL